MGRLLAGWNALAWVSYTNYELPVKAAMKPPPGFLKAAMSGAHHQLLNRGLHVGYLRYAEEAGMANVIGSVNSYVYTLLLQLR